MKKKRKLGRKLLSFVLTLAMLVGLMPGMGMTAYAATNGHALSASVVGEIVGSDGLAYDVADKGNLPTGVTAAAVVVYKGETNGLAMALADETSMMDWETATGESGAAAHTPSVTGQTWTLPTLEQWQQMLKLVNDKYQHGDLNTAITTAGGNGLQSGQDYWSSTQGSDDPTQNAYRWYINGDNGNAYFAEVKKTYIKYVRACFAFTFEKSDPVAVTGVTLNPDSASLTEGSTTPLTVSIEPTNATDKKVKWSVGGTNASAVTLYSDSTCNTPITTGTATSTLTVYAKGISAGSATVTVTSNADSTKTASCDVTVNAAQTQTETLLTTITPTSQTTYSETTSGVVTVSQNSSYYSNNGRTQPAWLWEQAGTLEVSGCEGYTITEVIFKMRDNNPVTDSNAPFQLHFDEEIGGITCRESGEGEFYGVSSIEVYGYSSNTHSFTYEASGNTITATCSDAECTLVNKKATLTIAAPANLTYNGSAKAAVITDENHIQGTAKVQYQTKNGDSYGTATETAPTAPGTYKASITLGEATASVEYTITATPLTITGATLTSRAYAKDNKNVDVTAVTFSGGTPTIGTDYTATAEMADDTAGDSKAVTVTVTLKNPNYSLAVNTFNTTVKISKATSAKPAAPSATSITDTGVTLTATEGYQYKRDGSDWQESNVFTGLTEGTSYSFYQRVKGDTNHSDSDSSDALVIKTKQEPISYAEYSKSGNFIVITTKTITEYIKAQTTSNTVWLNDGDFYVVKGEVTLNNGLVYSGNVTIILCDNSKLTIKGGIWHYGSDLTIYGQDGQSGEIVVEGDKNITLDNVPSGIDASTISKDSALDGGKIHINGGKLSVTPGAGQNMCGTGATIDFLSNVSFTGTKEGGTQETLTEGSYGAAKLNEFTGFDAKPVATVTTALEAKTLIYNGQAQELVTAGTATGGEMQYALGDANGATQSYTTSIPSKTNAGTYYVWYKVVGDANHNDVAGDSVAVKIAPADKTELNTAIKACEYYYNTIKDNADYAKEAKALADEIEAAKKLSDNDNAKPSDIGDGITKLNNSKKAAEEAVNGIIAAKKKETDDTAAANAVNEAINKLPAADKIATTDKAAIEAARKAYDALTADQKKKVSADTLKKLTDAEAALKEAEKKSTDGKTDEADTASELEAAKEEAQAAMNEQVTVTQKGNKFTVKWNKAESADGYLVYAQYCGKKATKPTKTITKNTTTKTTITKINGKKISLKKNFHVYVVPYKLVDGEKVVLGKSMTAHLVGAKNARYSNVKKLTLKKTKYTVKVGKTAKIKAKVTLVNKNRKHIPKGHGAKFRYKSSDTGIATVSKNGKVKGIKKGTCTIYVYSINGLVKKAKLTVK